MRLTTLLVFLATACYAQEFKKLRLGIGSGYTQGSSGYNDNSSNGMLLYLEPSYRINDRVSLGVRFESAFGSLFGFASGVTVASYGINGQYYFSNNNFRPFAGIGLGFYHPMLTGDAFYGYNSRLEETVLGFYPRAGFDWKHLSFTIDWNIASASKATIFPPRFQGSYDDYLSSNYLSLKLGITIGGGRKK
jgi:hypothetical protein